MLRGGPSSEYDVSLKTGAEILKHLQSDKNHIYHTNDIYVDKNGMWHIHGRPKSVAEIISNFDVIVNAMHGEYGEDGKVQTELERHNIPFTGSKSFASAIGMNKEMSKKMYAKHGIKTPYYIVVAEPKPGAPHETIHSLTKSIFLRFPLPVVVKPVASGSSVGLRLASSFAELEDALESVFKISNTAIVEEFIKGTEASVGVIDEFRDHEIYTLPPIEIQPYFFDKFAGIKNIGESSARGENNLGKDSEQNVERGRTVKIPIFDYEAKYSGKSKEIVPGNFTDREKSELERLAREAHKILGMRHYSRSDFIIHPKRGIYILETNSLPGLTSESLMPKALKSVGVSLADFLDHIIQLALRGK